MENKIRANPGIAQWVNLVDGERGQYRVGVSILRDMAMTNADVRRKTLDL